MLSFLIGKRFIMIEFPKKTLIIEFTTISSNRKINDQKKDNDFLSLGKENHTFFLISRLLFSPFYTEPIDDLMLIF